ncbi:MAG TPA: c-type cytochrome [Chloroflexota bacterium]|nr:c-type cytochrome [Chloroflexota bacterium]
MLKHLLLTTLAASIVVAMGYADQTGTKVVIPINKISPASGKQMYTNYCAPCHGLNGKGHGPAARALTTPPADLTMLSRNNRGKFPDTHIVAVLQFGSDIPAHGSAQMPVWGPILGTMNRGNSQDKQLRISNLSRYLETIQAK